MFSLTGRSLIVGGSFVSVLLLAFAPFKVAAAVLSLDLLGLLVWRVREADHSGAWFAVRRKWIDLAIVAGLLLGVLLFALAVPGV